MCTGRWVRWTVLGICSPSISLHVLLLWNLLVLWPDNENSYSLPLPHKLNSIMNTYMKIISKVLLWSLKSYYSLMVGSRACWSNVNSKWKQYFHFKTVSSAWEKLISFNTYHITQYSIKHRVTYAWGFNGKKQWRTGSFFFYCHHQTWKVKSPM